MSKATITAALGLFGLGLGFAGYQLYEQNRRITGLETLIASRSAATDEILAEVTRIRVEQNAESKGTAGLLEKLETFAPLLTLASTSDPSYRDSQNEMKAILRAFTAIGSDAYAPVIARLAELDPHKDYDRCKWLIEAAVAIDPKRGLDLARKVVLGIEKPHPRLRYATADLLLRKDLKLAATTLRHILLTESSRGVDPNRALAQGGSIPDPAAIANNGFFNFVVKYARAEDPKMEDTLLMVMGRTEQDLITVQECIKALETRGCERAIKPIQQYFEKPPANQYNPLFRNKCLDALNTIQGDAARPFFEQALAKEADPTVKKKLESLLTK